MNIFPLIPTAYAEPGPVMLYHNTLTNECGSLWIGDEFNKYVPNGVDWEEIGIMGNIDAKTACETAGYTFITDVPSKTVVLLDSNGGDVQTASFFYGFAIVLGMVIIARLFKLRVKRFLL